MEQKPLILPSLRGTFGDWVYYSCLMPVAEISSRVDYAQIIHPNKALSQLIQRTLEGTRAKHISDYLSSNKERFFNSLVLATYDGSPEWLEVGNFKSTIHPDLLRDVKQSAMDNLGFLRLVGNEKIFAVDGQHRLAGIRRALEDKVDLTDEQLSVIIVGHKKTAAGLRRTRRLFTTLNKTAVPVTKMQIIALDEDDVMAIVARRMVETDDRFIDPKIAVISSPNIPATNHRSLTTITNLYDLLRLVFMFQLGERSDRGLRFNRPADSVLEEHYKAAMNFFAGLARTFPVVRKLFESVDPEVITKVERGPHGGHLLFRPIGLELVTKVVTEIAAAEDISLDAAFRRIKGMPTKLSDAPYNGIIWDESRRIMIAGGKRLARDLIKYMAGANTKNNKALLDNYRRALGRPDDPKLKLPPKFA